MTNVTAPSPEEVTVTAILGTIVYLGGFIGNLLSLAIFARTEVRRVSTGLLFLYLTLSNNVHLLTLVVEFIDSVYYEQDHVRWEEIGLTHIESQYFARTFLRLFQSVFIRCRLVFWLQNVSRSLSSFIACTISYDRMIRVVYPGRARHWCTSRTASQIVLAYSIIFALLHTFYFCPHNRDDAYGYCSVASNPIYRRFMSEFWPLCRAVLVCLFPTTMMIVANIRVWRCVRASKRRVAPSSNVSHSHSTTEKMLIFLTITNVMAFVVTQVPFHVYTIIVAHNELIEDVRAPILLWSSLYFGVGFYVYCLASPYFRSKFFSTINYLFQRKPSRENLIRNNTISQRIPN